jgi:hypothetical protein
VLTRQCGLTFKLTAAEDAEEVHLIARLAAFRASPEAKARTRISDLERKERSAAEQSELDSLRARYPEVPADPDHPMKRSFDAY